MGGGDALAGDLAVEVQLVKQLAGGLAIIAAVQVAGAVCGQDVIQLAAGGLQRGRQQRRVVPVRPG
jgi:hypothetical protein